MRIERLLRFSARNSAEAALRRGALDARRRPADVVAAAGVLDLQHVGAVVGQQQRAEAAGQQAAEVEHADAGERERVMRQWSCIAARARRGA